MKQNRSGIGIAVVLNLAAALMLFILGIVAAVYAGYQLFAVVLSPLMIFVLIIGAACCVLSMWWLAIIAFNIANY